MDHVAPGTQYRVIYGLTVFDCAPLRASLQPTACAANWRTPRDGSLCRGCATGAAHAGKAQAPEQPAIRLPCVRCGQKDDRLIGGVLCRSDYNRTREVIRGTNAKGCKPWIAGATLHETCAIVDLPDADRRMVELYRRRKISSELTTRRRRHCLNGLPHFEVIEQSLVWLTAVATGRAEVERAVDRLLPGGKVVEFDQTESFADRWQGAVDSSGSFIS